ncbi:MAG: ion channel [Flavobacteriales bacterium]
MINTLYSTRFQIFFYSLLIAIFGPLILPHPIYYTFISPLVLLVNLLTSFLVCSKNKKKLTLLFALFIATILLYYNFDTENESSTISYLKYSTGFIFYLIVSLELIKQIVTSRNVNTQTLFGLAAGYISLGLGGFFIYQGVELYNPNSFSGLLVDAEQEPLKEDSLLYFSFVTLLTIGYGDIKPMTSIAQKATILVGLTGQFYIIFIMAIVMNKFNLLNKKEQNTEK